MTSGEDATLSPYNDAIDAVAALGELARGDALNLPYNLRQKVEACRVALLVLRGEVADELDERAAEARRSGPRHIGRQPWADQGNGIARRVTPLERDTADGYTDDAHHEAGR